jgi:hypothetical protein
MQALLLPNLASVPSSNTSTHPIGQSVQVFTNRCVRLHTFVRSIRGRFSLSNVGRDFTIQLGLCQVFYIKSDSAHAAEDGAGSVVEKGLLDFKQSLAIQSESLSSVWGAAKNSRCAYHERDHERRGKKGIRQWLRPRLKT